ncbi:hypothetical protein MRX96_045267 [Rhipicephalus microplus]
MIPASEASTYVAVSVRARVRGGGDSGPQPLRNKTASGGSTFYFAKSSMREMMSRRHFRDRGRCCGRSGPQSIGWCCAPTERHGKRRNLKLVHSLLNVRPVGGLDLHTTTHGVLLKTLCNFANIDYAAVHTADRVRINPYNNSHTVSTPFKPRARLYLCASELHLGTISYSLRAYMAAPDDALHGVIYNAVISQTQDEIIQNLQSMNLNSPYTIADAHQMGTLKIYPN